MDLLEFSTAEREALQYGRFHHPPPRVQLKMEVLYLTAETVCELLQLLASAQPGVPLTVVLDNVLPGLPGPSAIRKIRRCAPGVRVLILTERARDRDVAAALIAGASGYALKGDSKEEILRAIWQIQRGRLYLGPGVHPHIELNLGFAQVMASPDPGP